MKKISLFIFLFLTILQSGCLTTSNEELKKRPIAAFKSIKIESVSLSDIVLCVELEITNPYVISIDVNSAIIEAYIEGERLVNTSSKNPLCIIGEKTASHSFKINLKWNDISRASSNYMDKEEIVLKIVSLMNVKLPAIPGLPESIMLTYTTEKKLPALKPEIAFTNYNYTFPSRESIAKALAKAKKSPLALVRILGLFAGSESEEASENLSDMDLMFGVDFDFNIINHTKSKITIDRVYYDINLNNIPFVRGISAKVKNEGNKSTARLENRLNTRSLHRSFISSFAKKKFNLQMGGYAIIKFPSEISSEPVVFNFGK